MEYYKIIFLSLVLTVIFGIVISFKPGDAKIYGGVKADPESFPYQVSIRYLEGTHRDLYNEHICAGSILSEHYILTAAHCFDGVHKIRVVAGQVNLKRTIESIYRDTDYFIIHPDFERHYIRFQNLDHEIEYAVNDIAIIWVKEPFDLTHPFVSKVNLATSNNQFTKCYVSGWGLTEEEYASEVLLYTTVDIIPIEQCLRSYIEIPNNKDTQDGMVCANWIDPDGNTAHDACSGDSGGPLICDQKQVGIVSFGVGCGKPEYPGVYMNVAHFYEWIQATINESTNTTTNKDEL